MSRPGRFYDQDDEPGRAVPPQAEGPPSQGRRGAFFDQDADPSPRPVPPRAHHERQDQHRREEVLRQEQIRRRQEDLQRRHEQARRHDPPRARGGTGGAGEQRRAPPAGQSVPAPQARRPRPLPAGVTPLQITSRPDLTQARSPAPPTAPRTATRPPPARPAGRPGASERGRQTTGQATAVLAAGTFASRLTGFLRVLAVGYVLGVSTLSDAFNYANGVPNIIYDLLLGGILSATLIPVFVTHLDESDRKERSRSLSAILTMIAVTSVGVSLLLWVAAPWVIRFYLVLSPSSTGPAEKALATTLLRYFAPQVFFLGTIVATTALLNAARRFSAAALSPVLNNVVAIAALLATKAVAAHVLTAKTNPDATLHAFAHDSRAVAVLGIGTSLGYAVQLLVQLPALHRIGLRLRPVWDPGHPAVRRVVGLSSWLIGVVLANQAALAVVTILAGRTDGGLTAYQFSYQFFQLPYALVAVSVASAIMPDLSQRWSSGDRVAFERQFVRGLRMTLAVLIPLALVYMAVARPFIQLAIHHGRVTGTGAHLVTTTLVYFAAGLPGFSAFFLLMRAYQAMQDAKTMFLIYVLENGLTLILAPILSPVLGVPGLALAWVGPYTVASLYAVYHLRGRVGALGGWLTVRALIRICIASAVTGAAAVAVGLVFPSHGGDAVLVGRLVTQAGVGTAVYLFLARHFRIREIGPLLAVARRIRAR